ncbi:cation:proton antiporter [Limosilactobacillus equigenerosi]|uniref:cation:proton antiporter n=1 Tax=Limosilactobacillus equigenerosi TaxID=417373 RepID=UPI0006D2C4E0|nr:cation:proton antiporter [Limosilactobacillus equigenerosi]
MVSIANLLILVLATTMALVIQRGWLHRIAVNYIALAMGILIAVIPWLNHHVTAFNETVFMGGLVAPLLFFDGKEMRLGEVRQQVKPIVGMTVVMALLALLATGFTLRGVFGFSLPLAFLLAAISIPTDATATGAVAQGVQLPPRAVLNLKLESLFNDASGLILMSMALEWFHQGEINYQGTAWSFVYAAVGGVIFGWLVAWGLLVVRHHLHNADTNFTNSLANNGTPVKVLLLLTPFLVYFGAEHFHLSGIIAVVVAGLVGNTEDERNRLVNPALAYDNQRLIASLQELMNGSVFVILGVVLVRTIMNDRITYGSWTWIWVGIVLYS